MIWNLIRSAALVAPLMLAWACTPEVPVTPSFQQDVLPILAANCVRCHGFPTIGGAPAEFRLDSFSEVAVSAGETRDDPACGGDPGDPAAELVICGAARYALISSIRTEAETRPMPPRFPLDDYQVETLARWAEAPERGAPHALNRIPAVSVEEVSQAGAIVTLRVRVDDEDRDLVAGTLRAIVATVERFVGAVASGTVEIAWDTTGIPAGDHALIAYVDDGAQVHAIALGTVAVGPAGAP